jgi:hypothetical protein
MSDWLHLSEHEPLHGSWVLLLIRDDPHLVRWDTTNTAHLLKINPHIQWQYVNLPTASPTSTSSTD